MSDKFKAIQSSSSLVPGFACSVKAESFNVEMDILGCFCADESCLCEDVTLHFYTAGSLYKDQLFKIVINYASWKLVSAEIISFEHDCLGIIQEFMDSLNDALKSMILTGKAKMAYDSRYTLLNDYDYSDMITNTKIGFADVFHVEPYEAFAFEYDKTRYLILDYYCPNPKCDCMDVMLSFRVMNKQKFFDESILEYLIDFRSGQRTIHSKVDEISMHAADELFAEFEELLERQHVEPLVERYYRMKKWGEEVLENKPRADDTRVSARSAKIGRNSPCPCGSGRKYKKCCGA